MALRKTTPKKAAAKKPAAAKPEDLRRDIIMKAVADPIFRRKLLRKPEDYFGKRMSKADRAVLGRMKVTLPALDELLTSLSGEILCTGGGGCPNLA